MSGPLKEPFEIKVYEIDDVERLQRRRQEETAEVRGGPSLRGSAWRVYLALLVLDHVMSGPGDYEPYLLSRSGIPHRQQVVGMSSLTSSQFLF